MTDIDSLSGERWDNNKTRDMKYSRILLKLSGESLAGESGKGLATEVLDSYSQQIKKAVESGVQIGIVIGGGTSNPYFSTDSASALRGVEIEAEVLLKGTRVDGVYTADPEKDPTATKFDEITFDEVYGRGLKIMDLTAFTLCKENHLPIIVFDMDTEGNLQKVLDGDNCGTLVHN